MIKLIGPSEMGPVAARLLNPSMEIQLSSCGGGLIWISRRGLGMARVFRNA